MLLTISIIIVISFLTIWLYLKSTEIRVEMPPQGKSVDFGILGWELEKSPVQGLKMRQLSYQKGIFVIIRSDGWERWRVCKRYMDGLKVIRKKDGQLYEIPFPLVQEDLIELEETINPKTLKPAE